jgi:selenocysteine-specific elongation factor
VPLTLGTAGHIDHGKTALVEALTGTNTDRLPEEQARGISIELGYAPLELPGGRRLSVIDVPGHERFVRTMVAGATGIDLFLLVVDAGEGPRAQTFEHVQILKLLGVEHGVVALTKIDAVDPERIEEPVDLVPGAEIVRVSALTGEGLDELRAALERAADAVGRRERGGATRLYVDRVFSLPGAGTVVTGTLWSGEIAVGDRLQVLPDGFEVRVRSVQVHGEAVERAEAGQRVAVAVAAERRRRPERGDALVEPGAFPVSFRLDVELAGDVADGARVQVCHGTTAVSARVVRAGARNAQLRLERPLITARGDRVVLRAESTVGGGIVLDPSPPRHSDPERVGRASVSAPVRIDELHRRGVDTGRLEQAGEWVFAPEWLDDLRLRAHAALAARAGEPDPGLPVSALVGDTPWAAVVAPLLGLERVGARLYLPGERPAPATRDDEVRLGDGSVISRDEYERAKEQLVEECERAGSITLARFRDLLGVSRRVAQLLLERFDVDRVTLRVGDERRLRRSAARR